MTTPEPPPQTASKRPKPDPRLTIKLKLDFDGSAPFRRTSDLLVPRAGGVYALHDLRGILYVGRTNDLLRRFQEHEVLPANPLIALARRHGVGELRFSWIVLPDPRRRRAVEAELIQTLDPPCNRCTPNAPN